VNPQDSLHEKLRLKMAPLGELTLPQLLNSVQVLPRMASELVIEELMSTVSFTNDEQVAIVSELWKGVNLPAPNRIDPGELWLTDIPENYHEPLRKRYTLLLNHIFWKGELILRILSTE
jgi:hypothetical protein